MRAYRIGGCMKLQDETVSYKGKERCSGSFHLAVGFLVIKDDSISERPSLWQWGSRYTAHLDGTYLSRNFATLGPVTDSRHLYEIPILVAAGGQDSLWQARKHQWTVALASRSLAAHGISGLTKPWLVPASKNPSMTVLSCFYSMPSMSWL